LDPNWVSGIIDGEGNFSIQTGASSNPSGYKFTTMFKVTQKAHSKRILLDLQRFFGCGSISIDNRESDTLKYGIYNRENLRDKLIPHLDRYPLMTSKQMDYEDFKRVLTMLFKEEDKTIQGSKTILALKAGMNKGRSFEDRWRHCRQKEDRLRNLHPAWVQAFMDGEGCFYFDLPEKGRANATFELTQNTHDIQVLEAIRNFFGVGYLTPKFDIFNLEESKLARTPARVKINQDKVIMNFVDKYPMLTRKQLDYIDWKTLIQLKAKGFHLDTERRKIMIAIKNNMNAKRDS